MPIQVLSDVVAAQIAAGEVVERPASVVKELLENSLDAGATAIQVDIRGAGTELIRIRDNGDGIPSSEIELALARHATSKLNDIDDLYAIHTLGFRGEALHSIASVSRLTLTSCRPDAEMGARIVAEGGHVIDVRGIGATSGTIIEVADLFYNVPARRKFLKSEATEKRHIVNVVSQYAMAYPDIRFQLTVDGRETFHSSGNGNLEDVLVVVLGLDVVREMIEVQPLPPLRDDLPPIKVRGFSTSPAVNRSNRSQIHLFVNGRAINDQRLTYAIVQAYHTILPQGRYPVAVIMIDLAPADVDVNVHPTKAEVRFRSPDSVFSAVQRAVRRAVVDAMNSASFSDQVFEEPRGRYERFKPDFSAAPEPDTQSPAKERETSSNSSKQMNMDFDSFSPGRYSQQIDPQAEGRASDKPYPDFSQRHQQDDIAQQSEASYTNDDLTAIPDDMDAPKRPRTLPILRVVGQISSTYIITEGPAGMYMIDQHAAHERILYEQYMAAYESQKLSIQQVMNTATVELGQLQLSRLNEYAEQLFAIGFEFEDFGPNTIRIKAVPAMLADKDPTSILQRLLDDIELGNIPGARSIEDKLVRKICKAVAVKAGQVLSHTEMQGIVRQLERCENPMTCPHGRPTLIHMSTDQLEKEFGRT